MDRRKFLVRSGAVISSGTLLSACDTSPSANTAAFVEEMSFNTWEDIRKQFLFNPDRIHMSQMLFAAHPKMVRDAIQKHRDAFDANPVEHWEDNWMTIDVGIRKKASEYMDAAPEEIALTDSTTMGLSILYNGLKLRSTDEILTTTHDHYVTEKSLEFAAAKTGASIKRVSLYTDPSMATVDEMVGVLKKEITPKTKIVAITFVHSCTGVKTPVKEIAAMIKEKNSTRTEADRIYLCVDGVHGFGIENVSIRDLDCDFFAAGTHKWIFGPRGTGVLYARKDAWHMIAPVIPSFEYNAYGSWLDLVPANKLTYADHCTPGGFHSFEHRWSLGEGFQFQLNIGKERVEKRSHELSARLKQGLANIRHIRLITPQREEVSAGINCFEVEGMKNIDVVKKLLTKKIIASESPYKISYARLTPCMINTEEEVDICLRELERIKESA
jgi:selenocysteine lyase/cysteine desulfurase